MKLEDYKRRLMEVRGELEGVENQMDDMHSHRSDEEEFELRRKARELTKKKLSLERKVEAMGG